jgi:hypothetical protein
MAHIPKVTSDHQGKITTDISSAQEALPAAPIISSSFKDFFWYSSGANRQILRQCSVLEGHKYVLSGIFVFSIGLLAGFSGGYALYVAFQSLLVALLFGLLWGTTVFYLNQLIVTTIKKEASPGRQWRRALPHIALAAIISVVIAKPLELWIFEPEILEILSSRKTEKMAQTEAVFKEKIAETERRIAALKAETETSYKTLEALYQDYRCECAGTCGTGRVGRGTECERKEAKYRQADQEYQALKTENDQLIAGLRGEAGGLKKAATAELRGVATMHAQGFMARLSAAQELPFLPGFLIALFVFMLGIAPVLFKVLAQPGSYDEALRVLEETRLKINL